MDLNQNFDQNKPSKKQFKKREYLREGGYIVTIKKVQTSAVREDYKGTPYFEFIIETNDGKSQFIKFWDTKPGDAEKTKLFKGRLLKEFLMNCGVVNFDSLDSALDSAVGKQVGVCLSYKEYWYEDRNTGEPKMAKRIEYKYSTVADKIPIYKDSYSRPMTNDDINSFKSAHSLWEKGSEAMTSNLDKDEDLPF
jgi:hypothetical protein